MPMLDAVAAYLEAQGLGTVKTSANDPATWPIYKGGAVPGKRVNGSDVPDVIYLAEGPGLPPTNEMGSTPGAVALENPSLVVSARHTDYATARAKAQAIWGVLHKKGEATLSGTRYALIMARGTPSPTGRDEFNRWVIGCNYDVAKEVG